MGSEHYCLRWNNHQSNLLGVFSQLLESESLVDVTLACTEGPSIRAHKVVLSACSSYFQTLFLDHPNRHPIVILKDVRFSELRTLVDFMYKGEVNVEYCQLSALLKTAESLKVKGLADMTNINAAVATRDEQQHHHHHQHHQHHQQHHQQQQQQHHHHNNDAPRETRNDTTRERDKEHRIDKEYNDKDNIKDELKLQNSHKDHIQQNKHNSLINQHVNDNSEAVDMTECPLTPKREIDSSPERPLALDRPRRDSDDAASLDDTRASISPVSVHSGPSDMSLTNNTTITTATTTAATTTTTTSSSSSSSSSSLSNNNNNSTSTTTTSTTTTTTTTPPTPTTTPGALSQSRLPSPHSTEPLAGPSGLPPVQQVPLSLKKEMDWDRSSDERCASSELSTDYRLPPDPMSLALGLDAGGWGALVERASATGSPLLGQHGSSSSLGVAGLASLARRCTVCLATFPSAWLLERHALLQHAGQSKEEKPFTCEQCGQRYRYRSAYVKHREQNHRARLPADKLFTCDVCGMQFRYLKSFKKHRLNHALERLQRGPENLASGISILSERAERSDQVSSTGEPSQLETGSEAASPAATGVSGIGSGGGGVDDIAKDSTETGDVNSETTSEQHDNNQDITEQAIDLHTGRNNVNSNDQLNNIDTDINNITTERVLSIVKAHHDTEKRERRFACPFCGKCVRSKENLKLHVRKHTGERPFVCLFCGRAFGGKSDLTRHLRIHTGERPYHCEMCGKCFARADYLSKHLTTHIHQR
ncbi:gastrula zinc finger protein XlCGF48.2-like isoform X2 [Aphidius gifuensis]|uniref:gastrula zinc finger protein XlCGF48.2-like isoform X2 n=1 Tax=Aphidius gifuensis TaxID=684658 RepID=UPI001CDB8877|nr:gastrula zinc finger protein XlCGF48.2-like isoform X2 [Aphidius gifuensis]